MCVIHKCIISGKRNPDLSTYGFHRRKLHSFVNHRYFSYFIYTLIILSVICMATEHYNMSKEQKKILRYVAYGFTAAFVVEATLKLIAFGKFYFYDG